MDENQTFTETIAALKPGMIMDANGEIAVIVDILRSEHTDAVCLFVRFPRNLGNARPYDILELSPARTLGVEQWRPATQVQLEQRLAARREWLEREMERLKALASTEERTAVAAAD